MGAIVLRRPGLTLAITVLALSALVAGLIPFRTNYDQLASLPGNTESVRSFELLRGGFPEGVLSPLRVYVSSPASAEVLDPDTLERLDTITLDLAGHPAVADVSGPSRPLGLGGPPEAQLPKGTALRFVSADGSVARLEVVLNMNPYSEDALDVVPELRALARESAAAAGLPSGSVLIGGNTAEAHDTRSAGNRDSLVVLPLILLAIGVVLALLLRSLIAPFYLMVTIAFTYFATLGLATLVFVVSGGPSGSWSRGPVLPVRVPECAERRLQHLPDIPRSRGGAAGAPCREATRYALARTGPGDHLGGPHPCRHVLSALMTLPLQDLLQLGFAVAVGVLIDTFITRTLIVPSVVALDRTVELVALPHRFMTSWACGHGWRQC